MEDEKALTTQRVTALTDPGEYEKWAEVFVKSGLFAPPAEGGKGADILVQTAQAKVKILAGTEMGLQPFFAMQNLYVVKQKVFVSAAAFGALVNGSGSTKFITKESTDAKAVIEFYRRDGDKWEVVHTQTYTWDDVPANRKAQSTYISDRADMLWNRCMTKGARKACPELVGGMRSVEEAREDAEWQPADQPLIPEKLPGKDEQQEESGAAPAEQPAEPVKPRRGRPPRKPPEAVVTPPDGESTAQADEPPQGDESGPAGGEFVIDDTPPEFSTEESVAADMEDAPMPDKELDIVRDWVLREKFPLSSVIKGHGWPVKEFANLRASHFPIIRAVRQSYITDAAKEFGWKFAPENTDLTTSQAQAEQLQKRHQQQQARAA